MARSKKAASKDKASKAKASKAKASKTKSAKKPAPQEAFTQPSLQFLNHAHAAVQEHLAGTTDLPEFLESAGTLTQAERITLVEQALLLIEANYVHLPLKEAMHGVDPVQRLKLIQHRLEQSDETASASGSAMDSEWNFHRAMLEVFNSLRDLHTNYLLPAPFNNTVAFLPFEIEEYFKDGQAYYIATHLVPGFSHRHFKSGVEITHWNGVPIQRAVEVIADRHAGSNEAARHVRGVDGLTIRPLQASLPPDELWVVIGYIDRDGKPREMRQDWLVTGGPEDGSEIEADTGINLNATCLGVDLEADLTSRMKKLLFAPKVVAKEQKQKKKQQKKKQPKTSTKQAEAGESLESTMPGVFNARNVETAQGNLAYIRIFTFGVNDPQAFVEEFIRLAGLLPQAGLIIDVRGNGGGHIWASEGLLQVLTSGEIEPEPVQFLNTPLNLRICDRHASNPVGIDLGPWVESMRGAVETGAVYSQAAPITPNEFANAWGQHYHGPVVLITDARCYSATDIFAAGFQDHNIGPILGVDDNTGAGGANVWTHELLDALLRFPEPIDPESPYAALPQGADMRVSIRRTLRVGDRAGTPVEDLGVQPDQRYRMTKNDLLNSNADLIEHAAGLLAALPVRQLSITTHRCGSTLEIEAQTRGMNRLDIYLNGRPVGSHDVEDGGQSFDIQLEADSSLLELAGFNDEAQVATRKLAI